MKEIRNKGRMWIIAQWRKRGMDTNTHTQKHTRACTCTHTHTHTYAHTHTHTNPLTLHKSQSPLHTYTHTRPLARTQACTHPRTHARSHTLRLNQNVRMEKLLHFLLNSSTFPCNCAYAFSHSNCII